MNKSKEKPLFEGVTDKQLFEMSQIGNEDLTHDTQKLIHIPVISALSWQEAEFILQNRLYGANWKRLLKPKTASQIPDWIDTDQLPFWKQIYCIRKWAGSLQWGYHQLSTYLMRCAGVREVRDLDREKARKIFIGLMEIVKRG